MERGNTKHGPARDDELAHEAQAMTGDVFPATREAVERWLDDSDAPPETDTPKRPGRTADDVR